MAQINSYLTFNGNCREAMTFYKECLGGELFFQPIGDSPAADTMPNKMKNAILHSTLTRDGIVLMATDMTSESGRIKGNAVSLMLACDSEAEITTCFKKLSAGGKVTQPLEHTFFNSILGNLTDKFGNNWLLNYNRQNG